MWITGSFSKRLTGFMLSGFCLPLSAACVESLVEGKYTCTYTEETVWFDVRRAFG